MKFMYFLLLIVIVALSYCEAREPRCLQPTDPGICYGHVPKYAYNNEAERCEQFIYGGCMGNDNRFDTLEACQAAC
ncbi:hypothetical protein B5X24_HaOG203780 [Helicoverpa armigera]|nr:hypothetical protein B5X24_HaOG203780 [Helicoverpa armigera]